MKKLIFLLLVTILCNAQNQGNFNIPDYYSGTWINSNQTDIITINANSITWTSNQNEILVSYTDVLIHTDPIFFSFYSYPNAYILSLEKISRVKLYFFAQTSEGFLLANETYFKQGTRQN